MKFIFLVEDYFGPAFFRNLFYKKRQENILSGQLKNSYRCALGPKLARLIRLNIDSADRIIIIADADGQDHVKRLQQVEGYVENAYKKSVRIVLLDYEIEEWLCHSAGIKFRGQKPSSVLKHRKKYAKDQLPSYGSRLDCERLRDCGSFGRFLSALEGGA